MTCKYTTCNQTFIHNSCLFLSILLLSPFVHSTSILFPLYCKRIFVHHYYVLHCVLLRCKTMERYMEGCVLYIFYSKSSMYNFKIAVLAWHILKQPISKVKCKFYMQLDILRYKQIKS